MASKELRLLAPIPRATHLTSRAAESINVERLVVSYVRLYPLFQQAYLELGYPQGYFNDRLISVIDHLLAAPELSTPLYVSQPKVLYEFVDPELEDLSAGHKIMVRVGVDNERRLKAQLRKIRAALTNENEYGHGRQRSSLEQRRPEKLAHEDAGGSH